MGKYSTNLLRVENQELLLTYVLSGNSWKGLIVDSPYLPWMKMWMVFTHNVYFLFKPRLFIFWLSYIKILNVLLQFVMLLNKIVWFIIKQKQNTLCYQTYYKKRYKNIETYLFDIMERLTQTDLLEVLETRKNVSLFASILSIWLEGIPPPYL